ncbi:hypothetical protein L1K76_23590, partial [Salmonella enterica subsp. enterica serovar Anatum]|nr:hypothetical protein [Salmonella enterica subsp. enterica serovar Anatum]
WQRVRRRQSLSTTTSVDALPEVGRTLISTIARVPLDIERWQRVRRRQSLSTTTSVDALPEVGRTLISTIAR